MSKQQVNGVVNGTSTSSATFDHFTSYPLVTDLVNFYKSQPLGQKSISLSQEIYNRLGKPVLSSPLVQSPYAYLHPYAKRADEVGDTTLSHLDANFPVLKNTDLTILRSHVAGLVALPFQLAGQGKEYVLTTFDEEYKKTPGGGLVKTGKAVVGTEFRIATETLAVVLAWVGQRKKDAEGKIGEIKGKGEKEAHKAKKVATEKKDELSG